MKVVCVMPAHNEEGILETSVRTAHGWGRERFGDGFELVVSENGSTDATARIAGELAAELGGISVVRSSDSGKGGAVKRGMAAVDDADAYLMMDADLSTHLDSAMRLVEAVLSGVDVAIGSRRMPDAIVERPMMRRAVTTVYAAAAQVALGLGVRDLQCGCKAFSRRVRDMVVPIVGDDEWFFDTELLAIAKGAGMPIVELGVRWAESPSARPSKVRPFTIAPGFIMKLLALRRREPSL